MKRIFLFVFWLASIQLQAQETQHNSLSFHWGMGHIQRQDQTFSTMIHEKWSPFNFSLIYQRTKKLVQIAILKYGLYKPTIGAAYSFRTAFNASNASTRPHSFNMVDIQYGMAKPIIKREKLAMALGLKSKNRIWHSAYEFGVSGVTAYYLSLGVDVWAKFTFQVNENNQFNANIGLPVFSYIYRNPYAVQDDNYFEDISSHKDLQIIMNHFKRGTFQSWDTSQSFDFDISYYHQLSNKWDVGLSYLFSLNTNQSPTKLASIEQVFYISGKLKF